MSQTQNILNLEPRKEVKSLIRNYWELMKPELTLLSVFTSVCTAFLATNVFTETSFEIYFALALGTLLLGGGSGALNQYFERNLDAKMDRTAKRPIPSGKVSAKDALLFGTSVSILGSILLLAINILTGVIAIATLVIYVFLYTPLKRLSPVSTTIGAIPGALPVFIGWASITNEISTKAIVLFAVLFYWQLPHFYSLAWMYRDDYAKAGYRLLTTVDKTGKRVSRHILINLIILFFVGLIPAFIDGLDYLMLAGTLLIGAYFLYSGIRFARNVDGENSVRNARAIFFASLLYIPIYFTLLVAIKFAL